MRTADEQIYDALAAHIDDAESDRRLRAIVDQVAGDDPQRRQILAGPNGTALRVQAGDAKRGMLLAHMRQGEPVGLEIRHVEPHHDGAGVTIVVDGGTADYHPVDQVLELADRDEAREARARLAARQRTDGQAGVLRHIAALAEGAELAIPHHLRITGDLPSLEILHAAAETLGVEMVQESPGFWQAACRFGADEYTAPVELLLTHYSSEYYARESQ